MPFFYYPALVPWALADWTDLLPFAKLDWVVSVEVEACSTLRLLLSQHTLPVVAFG